jgi:RES domain-containing protein
MIVYRLSKAIYANDLSGFGAEKSGGRWNSQGIPMVYASQSRALSTAEIAVHTPMGIIPDDYVLITLVIPGHSIFTLPLSTLPKDWKAIPPAQSTRRLGDQFIKDNKYLTMKVPSIIVQGEYNFLINPRHARSKEVVVESIEPFDFDNRLFIR